MPIIPNRRRTLSMAATNAVWSHLAYVIVFFLAGTFVAYLVLLLYALINHVDPKALYDSEGNLAGDAQLFVGSMTNFSVYLVGLVIILLLAKPYLLQDLESSRNNTKKFFVFIGQGILIYYVGNVIGNILTELLGITGDSENQKTIVALLQSKYVAIVLLTTVILAPLIEEIVFRKLFRFAFQENQNEFDNHYCRFRNFLCHDSLCDGDSRYSLKRTRTGSFAFRIDIHRSVFYIRIGLRLYL